MIFLKTYKYLNNPIINGTLLLTFAGGASRFIGFFYRIFLSRTIGAEGLGIYQLICPVMSLSFAVCSSGFQSAISKLIAETKGKNKGVFIAGTALSLLITILFEAILYVYADVLADRIFCEPRCAKLLRVLSFSLIPATIHACINGYYYGLKKTAIPAFSQLIEQFARVGSVYLIFIIKQSSGSSISPCDVVWGITICEIFGMLFSVSALYFTEHPKDGHVIDSKVSESLIICASKTCKLAIPMSLNYILLTLCTGLENILIPIQLQRFGYTNTDALSIYGILSGVALPVLLFPCVLTNSICVLLLPDISEAQAKSDTRHIESATKKALFFGALLGLFFTLLFKTTAVIIGENIFNSVLASDYLLRLCWLCPFMYVSSLMGSILHGLGKPKSVLAINTLSGLIRISMIIFAIPLYGINAYLWSMLVAQIFTTIAFCYLAK